jgi:hypothetical protein
MGTKQRAQLDPEGTSISDEQAVMLVGTAAVTLAEGVVRYIFKDVPRWHGADMDEIAEAFKPPFCSVTSEQIQRWQKLCLFFEYCGSDVGEVIHVSSLLLPWNTPPYYGAVHPTEEQMSRATYTQLVKLCTAQLQKRRWLGVNACTRFLRICSLFGQRRRPLVLKELPDLEQTVDDVIAQGQRE